MQMISKSTPHCLTTLSLEDLINNLKKVLFHLEKDEILALIYITEIIWRSKILELQSIIIWKTISSTSLFCPLQSNVRIETALPPVKCSYSFMGLAMKA